MRQMGNSSQFENQVHKFYEQEIINELTKMDKHCQFLSVD